MDTHKWTLYCHQHIESGRRYIGLTKRTVERRWSDHLIQSKRSNGSKYFPNAIRKYGPEAFSHEVLAMSWDLEGANITEQRLIEQYQTRDPSKGFNLSKGGAHVPNNLKLGYKERASVISRKTHSRPEVKKKLSEASLSMWKRQNYRNKQLEFSKTEEFRIKCLSGFSRQYEMLRSRTHCCNGHEFTVENTLLSERGRICRACHVEACDRAKSKLNQEQIEARRKRNRDYQRGKRGTLKADYKIGG